MSIIHATRQPAPDCETANGLIAHTAHTLWDATEQAERQHWVDLEMHQLSAGAYQGSCTSLTSDKLHIVHEQQNQLVHKTGILPKNTCTISLAYATDPALRFSQFSNPMDSWLFFLPEQTEFDVNVSGNIETLYVALEQDKLLEAARTLNEAHWANPPNDLHAFNTSAVHQLGADLAALLTSPATADIHPDTLMSTIGEKMLVDSIALALNQSTEVLNGNTHKSNTHRRVHQRVSTAREFIDASLQTGHIPSIVEVCAQTGGSARTLQYAFREVMQMTPVTYLRILRLNKVRSALRAATTVDATVTRIATDWGFFHLGEFARDYQQLFGEYPSETLGRALARTAG